MGWFEQQIKQREKSDQAVFEESIFEMASSVIGENRAGDLDEERLGTRIAANAILKYFHFKPEEIPDNLTETTEQLEYVMRPKGIMYRRVSLKDKWYRDAHGPMMVFTVDGVATPILPGGMGGYYYKDSMGRKIRITRKNAAYFSGEGYVFYRPLPMRSLKARDLIVYVSRCFGASDIALLICLALLTTLIGMMVPRVVYILTGIVLESGRVSFLTGSALLLVSIVLSKKVLDGVSEFASDRLESKVTLSIQSAMMMRLLSLKPSFFRGFPAGELAERVDEVGALCEIMFGSVLGMVLTAFSSLLYIFEMVGFAPGVVAPALITVAATVVVIVAEGALQTRIVRREKEHHAKLVGLSYGIINGIPKIRLSGAEKRAFAKWASDYAEGAKLIYNPPFLLKIRSSIILAVSLIGSVFIYASGALTDVSPAEFLAFNAAFGVVVTSFNALAEAAMSLAEIRPVLEQIKPILEAEPEVSRGRTRIRNISGAIELNHVSFRYDELSPYVIDDLDMRIKPGEYVAIVGRSGCGKSTLMRLLLGFEEPVRGSVYYDGMDIRKIDPSSLRAHIGTVMQNGDLMAGDIYSNIAISKPGLSMDEAWEAATMAGIAEDIRSMPMGMNTMISDGGGGISGGQKQRLMIARAIASKPQLLIFDEATSALDNRTQKRVSDALSGLGCTRIVIAHRLSTIRNCDRILLMDEGRIVSEGSYDEMMKKSDMFRELVERQRLGNA
ncbi:MAG TPA: NHLP family bacteriocin export ABC transporter permease/ATPase subunit [Lachnospiraceae bacterium]|nr:NHLP family bacteriocin export ABC transporter permease/ATPase subunit [Lachnospiraceae bacterium]